MQRSVTIPDIGVVLINKKANATRLKLRVHPEKGVSVTIPSGVKFSDGELFVYKNIEWLKDKLAKQLQKKVESIFTSDSIFLSRKSQIRFFPDEKNILTTKIRNFNIDFFYNPSIDFSNERVQSFIKKSILKGLEYEASIYLVDRAKFLSQKINLKFNSINIGNATSRWGSCDGKNNIRLSCRMLLLPNELIDYVIIHELCHIIHKNHSSMFYELLDKLVDGKSNELNQYLKSFTTKVIPGDFRFSNSNYLY